MKSTNIEPLISVIIPTYKNRGLLSQSIESALNQDYSNKEIIVVDDNNPDSKERKETETILKNYTLRKNVFYIKHEVNKNGAAARNTGIRFAKGEYIAFLDDDDFFLQGKLTKQKCFLEEHPEFSAVYCFAFVGEQKEPTIPYEGDVLIPLLMNKSTMFTPTLMFRREAIYEIGGFDESFRRHQDYELLIKFFKKGFLMGCLQDYLVQINPVGGNQLNPVQFEELKRKYLTTFTPTLDEIDQKYPGYKNKIIVNNYASVFISDLASGHLKCSISIFNRFFWKSPAAFCDYLWFFAKRKFSKSFSNK